MDLRSRTVPERQPMDKEPSEDSECGREVEGVGARGSPTVILEDEDQDLTIPFETEIGGYHGESTHLPRPLSPVGARDRETSPMVRWPIPPRIQGGPINDFDIAMRGFMDREINPSRKKQEAEPSRAHRNREGTISADRETERKQYTTPAQREGRDCTFRADYGRGAVGGSVEHESSLRTGCREPRNRNDVDEGRCKGNVGGLDYDRLLPDGSRYRGRAAAHRPAMYNYGPPGFDYRFPDHLFSEPRPYFPTFSGRHDEWDAFWLKFRLMARRYNWSDEKQQEQLLFCLKDDALNFAASLGPEIRENLMLFSQALRDRFSHRTPAETVRASLNNIKKSSKETIQEYASRVRTMMSKAYPDIGCSETFNQMTIHHLLQGLPDQIIAYEVLIRKPNSLTEAVDMITWHECCKETTRKKPGVRQLSEQPYVHDEDIQQMDVRRINGKKFVTEERLIQFGRDLKATIEKLFKDEQAGQENQNPKPKQENEEAMPRRRDGRPIICYYCNEPGHISVRCPLKTAKPGFKQQSRQEQLVQDQEQTENGKGLSQQAGAQTH